MKTLQANSLAVIGARRRRAALAAGLAAAQKTQLLVYTALETDQIKAYEEALQQGVPGHRDQVGARLDRRHHREAARREGQSAGRHRGRHLGVEHGGVRQRRHAAGLRAQGPRQDRRRSTAITQNPPRWVGMDVYGAAICFNTVEAQKQNLPKPDDAGRT